MKIRDQLLLAVFILGVVMVLQVFFLDFGFASILIAVLGIALALGAFILRFKER